MYDLHSYLFEIDSLKCIQWDDILDYHIHCFEGFVYFIDGKSATDRS